MGSHFLDAPPPAPVRNFVRQALSKKKAVFVCEATVLYSTVLYVYRITKEPHFINYYCTLTRLTAQANHSLRKNRIETVQFNYYYYYNSTVQKRLFRSSSIVLHSIIY